MSQLIRAELQAQRDDLAQRFWRNEPIEELMADLSKGLDDIITRLFNAQFSPQDNVAIFAVGGYGRQEMYPGSDIDLLVLAGKPIKLKHKIEAFVQSVFDLNLEVGHSVRDVKMCSSEAKQDITVATALFERRVITGDKSLVADLAKAMSNPRLWPADKFFIAKYDEQRQRHKDYDDVEYKLEPNIKTSPGGLRDIHTTLWVCNRKFGTVDPDDLEELGVLSAIEKRWLVEGQRFLSWVRFGLHLVAERKEDQLQFGHQRDLSQRLGFVDTDGQLGVERFMHHYYRHVLALTEVNDIVLQQFREAATPKRKEKLEDINERFQLVNSYIEVCHEQVFAESPQALLEIFVIMANRNDIVGVRASTIRLVRDHLHLIDDQFRNNPAHNKLFMNLVKAPYTLVSQLTRMRRYGVLGRYLPEFGQIIGQMQHDLFHIYTVDAHTMMVIRNMRRFRYRVSEENYPVAFHCVHTIPKLELLYIAGLYHDIGKGRGGDHSTLGAIDAEVFCRRHDLNKADTELVCWLVEKHLYMSSVSQREDIYDPDVVHRFATEVKSEMRLDYLYALTVADVCATNPTLWNSWRASLLRHLYNETRKMLRRGLESPADRETTVDAFKDRALERLSISHPNYTQAEILAHWQCMGDDFFLRHTPKQIAQLSVDILQHDINTGPFVSIRDTNRDLTSEGATQIYVYSQDQPHLFARSVIALNKFELSVVDATVSTAEDGQCFDTYTVIDKQGKSLDRDETLRLRIQTHLYKKIRANADITSLPKKRLPRRLRELPRPTEVQIVPTSDGQASTITILASDRPGLLATVGLLFASLDLQLLSAKITTLGEQVEDTFVVQSSAGCAIAAGESTYTLENTLRQSLDQELGVANIGPM